MNLMANAKPTLAPMQPQTVRPKKTIRKKKAQKKVQAKKARAKTFCASIIPGPTQALPAQLVEAVRRLEKALNLSLVLFIQRQSLAPIDTISDELRDSFLDGLSTLPKTRPVGVLVHSLGGYARPAYQMARLLQKHCGGFTAVVPRYAKSAATLLTLGADRIVLHPYAELGPLDAQIVDPEKETYSSALDEVQALERLHAQSLTLFDSTMTLLLERSGKRVETLLPHALNFISHTTRPLYEKIDTVHFTMMSRVLKVAETYAVRLLQKNYPREIAEHIAFHLVYTYPEHEFVIDSEEAAGYGLKLEEMPERAATAADAIIPFLNKITAIGVLKERTSGAAS